MPRRKVRSVVRWLAIAVATSSLAFGLLTFALTSWATITGIAAALLLAIAGVRLSGALSSTPEDEQIEYPYHVAQRGRRLALASLLAAGGIAGFGLAPASIELTMGPIVVIVLSALALLMPPVAVMLVIWLVDGLTLRFRIEQAGDPLVGAAGSIGLAFALAVVASVSGFTVSMGLLVALGGLVPSLFVLWSLVNTADALAHPQLAAAP